MIQRAHCLRASATSWGWPSLPPNSGIWILLENPSFFFHCPPGGRSPIGVTTTPVTSISSAPTPLMKGLPRDSGISGYPFLIRGVTVIGGCPSHRQTSSTTPSRTAPCQSIPSRVISGYVIHQGRRWGGLWLERSSGGREGRVQLHRGEPVL